MSEDTHTAIEDFYAKKIKEIHPRAIKCCHSSMPIKEAARMMAHEKTSCIFVADESDNILGYVTDITLRDKVIAQGLSVDAPVFSIMDTPIVSMDQEALVYEALIHMFQTKTRYLLVKSGNDFVGMISRNKILTEPSNSPFLFIQSVKQATTKEELRQKWLQVPDLVYRLIQRGVRSESVNQIISTIADTVSLQVIENVLREKGPAPAAFVFFTLGSEGRMEQTLKTDQDNAIIYEDKANEQRETVRAYFLDFAFEVSQRLNDIGFSFCEGGFMAKNPKWTHSLSHWKRNYETWFQESSLETVRKYATFFDCRAIYGDFTLLYELKAFMGLQLQHPLERFFFNMTQNALQFDPQLTWLKNIRTFTVGDEKVFDIKKAMSPMVEAIRIYALYNRVFETNTGRRLKILTEKGVFDEKSSQELYQAYYYLMEIRLQRQAWRIIKKQKSPENYIPVDKLTKVQVAAIRETFKVIKDLQLKIKVEFTKSF